MEITQYTKLSTSSLHDGKNYKSLYLTHKRYECLSRSNANEIKRKQDFFFLLFIIMYKCKT